MLADPEISAAIDRAGDLLLRSAGFTPSAADRPKS